MRRGITCFCMHTGRLQYTASGWETLVIAGDGAKGWEGGAVFLCRERIVLLSNTNGPAFTFIKLSSYPFL